MIGDPFATTEHNRVASGLSRRHRTGKIWQAIFFSATVLGLVALVALLDCSGQELQLCCH